MKVAPYFWIRCSRLQCCVLFCIPLCLFICLLAHLLNPFRKTSHERARPHYIFFLTLPQDRKVTPDCIHTRFIVRSFTVILEQVKSVTRPVPLTWLNSIQMD